MTNGGVTHGASELLALISVLTAGKNLECGDLSPLLPLWRLVANAGPRPAARESWTPSCIRRRQVACQKRGQVRALQSRCGLPRWLHLRPSEVSIRYFTASDGLKSGVSAYSPRGGRAAGSMWKTALLAADATGAFVLVIRRSSTGSAGWALEPISPRERAASDCTSCSVSASAAASAG